MFVTLFSFSRKALSAARRGAFRVYDREDSPVLRLHGEATVAYLPTIVDIACTLEIQL